MANLGHYWPRTLAYLRLEAEIVALSQVSPDEMTFEQAERIRHLDKCEKEDNPPIHLTSGVLTPRGVLTSILGLKVIGPNTWTSEEREASRREYPESDYLSRHLDEACYNIPLRYVVQWGPRAVLSYREGLINHRQQSQMHLLRSWEKYRTLANTLPRDQRQFILTLLRSMETKIQHYRQKARELKVVITGLWEEKKREIMNLSFERAQEPGIPKWRRERNLAGLLLDISPDTIPPEDRNCGICREPYLGVRPTEDTDDFGEEPVQLPCGHIYGKACISSWLLEQGTCGFCRHNFSEALNEPRDDDEEKEAERVVFWNDFPRWAILEDDMLDEENWEP